LTSTFTCAAVLAVLSILGHVAFCKAQVRNGYCGKINAMPTDVIMMISSRSCLRLKLLLLLLLPLLLLLLLLPLLLLLLQGDKTCLRTLTPGQGARARCAIKCMIQLAC
jgi:hypothetical protein